MDDLDRSKEDLIAELVALRAQAQRPLSDVELDWERTFDSVLDPIAVLNAQHRILRVNRAMADRLGLTPSQCIGLTCYQSIHGTSQPPDFCPHAQTLADGQHHVVEVHEERLGGHFIVSTMPLLGGEGRIIGSVHVAHDITARKQAEEALRRSEERYRRFIEACPDAVVLLDLQGRVLFASPQSRVLLHLADDLVLEGLSVFDYVVEDDRPALADAMARLATSVDRLNSEYTALRGDGLPVPVEVSSVAIRDDGAVPVGLIAVVRDVTERKAAHDALQAEQHKLRHLLRASDHERQLIAYEIHDCLAQQLAAAIMQFQMVDKLWDTDRPAAQRAFQSGLKLVQQSHSETRRLISGVRPPILDEMGVVAAVAHLVHHHDTRHPARIEPLIAVEFDRLTPVLENSVYRIVQETLANACQHSGSERIRVSMFELDGSLVIEVEDWGHGFEPDNLPTEHYGLSSVKERVRLLGGTLSIDSQPGKGTRIRAVLPIVEPA
jgi:PAS domain S-box-containing protein